MLWCNETTPPWHDSRRKRLRRGIVHRSYSSTQEDRSNVSIQRLKHSMQELCALVELEKTTTTTSTTTTKTSTTSSSTTANNSTTTNASLQSLLQFNQPPRPQPLVDREISNPLAQRRSSQESLHASLAGVDQFMMDWDDDDGKSSSSSSDDDDKTAPRRAKSCFTLGEMRPKRSVRFGVVAVVNRNESFDSLEEFERFQCRERVERLRRRHQARMARQQQQQQGNNNNHTHNDNNHANNHPSPHRAPPRMPARRFDDSEMKSSPPQRPQRRSSDQMPPQLPQRRQELPSNDNAPTPPVRR